jgi:hypothetical protein
LLEEVTGKPVRLISSATGAGLTELVRDLINLLETTPASMD